MCSEGNVISNRIMLKSDNVFLATALLLFAIVYYVYLFIISVINDVVLVINGNWGTWESWSGCSSSCGIGQRSRSRACDSPSPSIGGLPCTVDGFTDLEVESCNSNDCTGGQKILFYAIDLQIVLSL